jgi:hypothetical protein
MSCRVVSYRIVWYFYFVSYCAMFRLCTVACRIMSIFSKKKIIHSTIEARIQNHVISYSARQPCHPAFRPYCFMSYYAVLGYGRHKFRTLIAARSVSHWSDITWKWNGIDMSLIFLTRIGSSRVQPDTTRLIMFLK